jgi:putative hydrolase of the HAD superfamily
VRLIAIDADDTLWYDGRYFRKLQNVLLKGTEVRGIPKERVSKMLDELRKNYPSGEIGFASAIQELAETVGLDDRELEDLKTALDVFLRHPVELLPRVPQVLALFGRFRKILVTKGRKEEQERKVTESGLGSLLDEIVILDRKDAVQFAMVLATQGVKGSESLVIGNSIQHDIIPAVENNAFAVWLNHSENSQRQDFLLPDEACEVSDWSEIENCLNSRASV